MKRQHANWLEVISAAALIALFVSAAASADDPNLPVGFRVIDPARVRTNDDALLAWRGALPEAIPGARGFRAKLIESNVATTIDVAGLRAAWQINVVNRKQSETLYVAAMLIANRLTTDGLPATFARVELNLSQSVPGYLSKPYNEREALLRSIGLPTDLLTYFDIDGSANLESAIGTGTTAIPSLVRAIDDAITKGIAESDLLTVATKVHFQFRPTRESFRVATEFGERDIGLIRMQATTGSYFQGLGDGGCIDVIRQMLETQPDTRFIISIERKHLAAFLNTINTWKITQQPETTIVLEDLPLSQWAQDNGKAGEITADAAKQPSSSAPNDATIMNRGARPFTLAPRFASRGEAGSVFVPGDSFACEGVGLAGLDWAQSPLLFQGGNLLAVWDAARGKRVLLVGEAEIERNVSLGLTPAQACEAFASEFACDDVVVLPAVSYHIDYEVAVRHVDNKVVALMNDEIAGAAVIVRLTMARLAGAKTASGEPALAVDDHQQVNAMLAADRFRDAARVINEFLNRTSTAPGRWPQALIERLSEEKHESPVANFRLFRTAVDILWTAGAKESDFSEGDHESAYYRSLCRRRSVRSEMADSLRRLGWRVETVPSIADAEQSICYLNGVQSRDRYLIPVNGGLFAPLDQSASTFIQKIWGPTVRLTPIRCAESFRRDGAVHCSASVYPSSGDQ